MVRKLRSVYGKVEYVCIRASRIIANFYQQREDSRARDLSYSQGAESGAAQSSKVAFCASWEVHSRRADRQLPYRARSLEGLECRAEK